MSDGENHTPKTPESRKKGRKPKLNAQLQQRIVELIEKGNHNETAAEASGINVATFYSWMQKGADLGSGPYSEFRESVTRARARAEQDLLAIVREDAKRSPESAMWILEHRFWRRWAKRTIRMDGDAGLLSDTERPPEDGGAPTHQEWEELKGMIMEALAPFPEAREAVANAIAASLEREALL